MRTMNNIKELLKEQIEFTDGYLDKYLAENGGKIDYIHGKRLFRLRVHLK